jgi:tetratricopeptide (TPR) repeat protein
MRDMLEQTLLIDPGHREAKLLLFQYYLETPGIFGGDKDKARRYAESFVKSDSSLGHYLLSLYWEDEGNREKTEKELLLSLKHNPENVNAMNRLGYLYLENLQMNESHYFFSRAIEVAPETANVYDSMGDFYATVSEFDSALIYYNRAIQKEPDFTVSIYNKARILEVLGRIDEALTVYRNLASRFPEDYYGRQARQRARELD